MSLRGRCLLDSMDKGDKGHVTGTLYGPVHPATSCNIVKVWYCRCTLLVSNNFAMLHNVPK